MKLIRREQDQFTFHLPKQEKQWLLAVLRRYPLIPSAHQPLSKSTPASETNQRLLDDALAEHREENRRRLETWLNGRRRFQDEHAGWQMVLTASDVEWLLQVLNDIRVGSWIILGAPDQDIWDFKLTETTAPHAWAMETAGFFQAALLEGLEPGGAT